MLGLQELTDSTFAGPWRNATPADRRSTLTLFEECKLDDESGRCKELSDAIAALTTAVEDRKNKPKTDECAASPRPTPKFSCPLVLLLSAQSLIPNCVAQSTSNL